MHKKLTGESLYELEKRLAEYRGPDRMVSSKELYDSLQDSEESVFIIPTGVPSLDRLLEGGVEAGELFIVSGPTDEGKSTILMSITRNMADAGVKTAWFTMEITPRQFIKKIGSRGNLPEFYLPMDAYEAGNDMLDWIQERIIESRAKFGTQVVFIDHLHQIFSLARTQASGNISWEMADLVGRIKNLAISLNIVIFLIAHNKDDQEGSAREPRKEDIRDSGLISRLADGIVMVWRVPNDAELSEKRRKPTGENDTKAKVRLMKNRRAGKYGTWFMDHENYHLTEIHDPFN
jgi:replicative DNA helicase